VAIKCSFGNKWILSQWPLVLAIVGGVSSLIGVITEKRSQSRSVKNFSYVLIFIGGLLTVVAAAETTIRQGAQQLK